MEPMSNLADATESGEISGTPSCCVVPVVPKQRAAPITARIPVLAEVVLIPEGYS